MRAMPSIEVGATIAVDLASKADLAKYYDLLTQGLANPKGELPIDLQASKTTPGTALAYTYIDLGMPKVGWLWDIMRLAASGNDPTTAVTGSVFAFIGRVPMDAAALDTYPQVVEIPGTIPNLAFYSRQQVIVRPGQHLVLGFKSLPNATQINVSGVAIQYRDVSAGLPTNTVRKPQ